MSILTEGKTPEEWAAVLAERSIPVSVRTLREAANRIGACHKLGRAMIITPDQMDMILQESQQCRLNRISAGPPSGHGAGSNTTAGQSRATTARAQAHLMRLAQGTGAGRKKSGPSAVISLAKRQSD